MYASDVMHIIYGCLLNRIIPNAVLYCTSAYMYIVGLDKLLLYTIYIILYIYYSMHMQD